MPTRVSCRRQTEIFGFGVSGLLARNEGVVTIGNPFDPNGVGDVIACDLCGFAEWIALTLQNQGWRGGGVQGFQAGFPGLAGWVKRVAKADDPVQQVPVFRFGGKHGRAATPHGLATNEHRGAARTQSVENFGPAFEQDRHPVRPAAFAVFPSISMVAACLVVRRKLNHGPFVDQMNRAGFVHEGKERV